MIERRKYVRFNNDNITCALKENDVRFILNMSLGGMLVEKHVVDDDLMLNKEFDCLFTTNEDEVKITIKAIRIQEKSIAFKFMSLSTEQREFLLKCINVIKVA